MQLDVYWVFLFTINIADNSKNLRYPKCLYESRLVESARFLKCSPSVYNRYITDLLN